MLKIEITSSAFEQFSGTSKAGKDYCFLKQAAHVFLNGAKYPEKFELTFNDQKEILQPGLYTVDIEKAVVVDRFGGLAIDGRKLQLIPAATRPAAAS